MSDELKPCPFCGSGRVAGFTSTCDSRLFREYVACEDCGASTTTHETKAGAVSAWNARAERTCRMNHVLLYDEEAVDGVECDECFYTEVHSLDDPLPDRCPSCGAKVVG